MFTLEFKPNIIKSKLILLCQKGHIESRTKMCYCPNLEPRRKVSVLTMSSIRAADAQPAKF